MVQGTCPHVPLWGTWTAPYLGWPSNRRGWFGGHSRFSCSQGIDCHSPRHTNYKARGKSWKVKLTVTLQSLSSGSSLPEHINSSNHSGPPSKHSMLWLSSWPNAMGLSLSHVLRGSLWSPSLPSPSTAATEPLGLHPFPCPQ